MGFWSNLFPGLFRAPIAAKAPVVPPKGTIGGPDPFRVTRRLHTRQLARDLTPDAIVDAIVLADQLQPWDLFELLDEVQDRDLHLVGVLGVRKRAVANLAWRVKPADTRRRSARVATWAEDRLKEIRGLEQGFVDLMDAAYKGVAMAELEWYNRPGQVGIRQIHFRPQRWFQPDRDAPEQWRLRDVGDLANGVELPPFRFVVHESKAKSGFPIQAGLGRPILWWYLFKNYAVKDWVSYAEIFGSPLRVGKHPTGATDEDIDALAEALDQLGVDASAVIPEDFDVKFVEARANSAEPSVYEKLVQLCDAAVSKGVLGQTLTTEAGAAGSYALGKVHNEVRQDLVVSDAKELARTLTDQLLTPLVQFQFGPDAPLPTFEFDTEPAPDQKAQAEAQEVRGRVFKAARDLGVPVPMGQVMEELGIRQPEAGEPMLGDDPQDPADEVAARHHPGHAHLFAARAGLPPELAQVEEAAARYLAEGGTRAFARLVEQLRAALLDAGSLDQVTERFVTAIQALDLGEAADELADATLTADLVGRAQVQAGEAAVDGIPPLPPTDAIAFWTHDKAVVTPAQFATLGVEHRSRAFTVAGWTSAVMLKDAHELLGAALRDGTTLETFGEQLEARQRALGLTVSSPAQIDNIFRTNMATAYAVGRDVEQRRPETLARRPYWRYRTAGDSRVRPTHEANEGLVYPADHPFWMSWAPPNGYRCRCFKTCHSAAEVQAKGWTVEEALPIDLGTGGPRLPDRGFEADPAREPAAFDWGRFPEPWRAALRAKGVVGP